MTFRIVGHGDKKKHLIDGQEVTEAEFYERLNPPPFDAGDGSGLIAWHNPIASDGLGVHPKQIPEAMEVAKRAGVPVEFTPSGEPIMRSSRQFRAYAKVRGMVHKGY